MKQPPPLSKLYITLDSNQSNPLVEEAILDYADIAYYSGYKDVQLVFTPLLFMERTNFQIHPEQIHTKRMLSSGDRRILNKRDRIKIEPFNEFDYDYMQKLSDGFKEHFTPEIRARIEPETLERVKRAAFVLKQHHAIPQEPPYDTCPASPQEIDPFDFSDLAVTAALYGVSGTRKYIHSHMKGEKFNSADYSMIAAFENHLSEIITPESERKARTIFVSQDQMLQDELIKAAMSKGVLHKAELHNRDSMMEYLRQEVVRIKEHMAVRHITLDTSEQEDMARLEANIAQWEASRTKRKAKDKDPEGPIR